VLPEVTTLTNNQRPGCLGVRVFAIIVKTAAAALLHFPLAYARYSFKDSQDSRWSIMHPNRYEIVASSAHCCRPADSRDACGTPVCRSTAEM